MESKEGTAEQQFSLPIGSEVIGLVDDQPENYRPGFGAWLRENMHVWRRFEEEALKVWHRGRRHYSAYTIMYVLRHESALADSGQPWKLNNDAIPDLSRLFGARHPACRDMFERRSR